MGNEELEKNRKICFDEEGTLHGFKVHDPCIENSLVLIENVFSLINLKKDKEFLDILEKTQNNKSDSKKFFYMLGLALLENEKFEESVKVFNKFIKIDPDNIFVWLGKGRALIELKRYEEALEASEKAIEIYEKDPITISKIASTVFLDAWSYKGHSLIKLERYEEALETYDKLIVLEPKNVRGWIGKFKVLWENHENEKVLETIEKAISTLELEDKLIWWELKGNTLFSIGKYKDAFEAYENGIKISPENAELLIGKGNIFLKLDDYNHALNLYEKAINIDSKNASAWKFKSIALLYLNRYTKFQEASIHTLKLDPKDAEMYNNLAEYYLMYGDIENASKYADNALLTDKDNAISSYIMGKVKIEEQNYIKSIRYFKKAISLDLRNPVYLLWDSYAKYLMAELEFTSDDKKYQDAILGIIRELEKINSCNDIEDNNSDLTSYWFFNVVPEKFKNLIISLLIYIKQKVIYSNISEKNKVKLLAIICPVVDKFENTRSTIVYNYYFLGCFYYKINDYSTAIECLKQCIILNGNRKIRNSASELLDNIWNTKIKPSILRWWLYSPSNRWFKRISFLILSFSLFGILLPSVASKIIIFAYNLIFKSIFTSQQVADFSIIEPIISTIIFSLVSFFSSVNWAENTTQLTFLTVIIIFILTSPSIQHFKSSQIEIEVRPPPEFELTPSLIEKMLNDF